MMYLRTAWVFINLVLSVLTVGPVILTLALFVKNQRVFTFLVSFWARWNVRAAGMRTTITGMENIDTGRQYVVMGNHESALDIFLVLARIPLPLRIVAKIELRKLPLVGAAMEKALFPFVDRRNHRKAITSLNKTFDQMAEHDLSVFIYPEGTRSDTGHLIPFKKGGFVLAIERQLPILPMVMCGAGSITPPGTMWVKGSHVSMNFLPPVETEGMTLYQRGELLEKVFSAMDDFQRMSCNQES